MTQFSFKAAYQKAEKDYGLGKGEYFKASEGDNVFRLLSVAVPYESEYQGKKNFKFLCWILDRKDSKVKLYFMPVTVFKAVEALQDNPDYHFTEVPMPYDLILNAKGAGSIDVEYKVFGARANTELTVEEQKAFAEKPSIPEVITKLNAGPEAGNATQPVQLPIKNPVDQIHDEAMDSLVQTADGRPEFLK